MFLRVFVTPGARRENIAIHEMKDSGEEILTISVREPAAGNAANRRVREIVAERLKKPLRSVRILTGHRSRSKMLSIDS